MNTKRTLFFLMILTAVLGTACAPSFNMPTPVPAVQTQLAVMDAEGTRLPGLYGAFLISLDGVELKQIYHGNKLRNNLRVSPDGEWVLYVEYTADQNDDGYANDLDFRSAEIGLMRLDGSDAHTITDDGFIDITPTWAPDGAHIMFASNRDNQIEEDEDEFILDLFVMDTEGEHIVNITNTADVSEANPSWSGDVVALLRHEKDADKNATQGIWMIDCSLDNMDECGSNLRVLTSPTFEDAGDTFHTLGDTGPRISPDGTRVVFYRHRGEEWKIGNMPIGDWDIYTIAVDGGADTLVSQGAEADFTPSWSPDGTRFAFSVISEDQSNMNDIYVIDVDGSNRHKVTDLKLLFAQMPDWVKAEFIEDAEGTEPWLLFAGEWVDGGQSEEE